MAIRFLFTSALSLIGSSILSAQTTAILHTEQLAVKIMNTIRHLEQNALLALIGVVVLMGLIWICSVWEACAGLNKSSQKRQQVLHNAFYFGSGTE